MADHEIVISDPGAAGTIADLQTIYTLLQQIRSMGGSGGYGLGGPGPLRPGIRGQRGTGRTGSLGNMASTIGTGGALSRLSEISNRTSASGVHRSVVSALRKHADAAYYANLMGNTGSAQAAKMAMFESVIEAQNRFHPPPITWGVDEKGFRASMQSTVKSTSRLQKLLPMISHLRFPKGKTLLVQSARVVRAAMLGGAASASATAMQFGIRLLGRVAPPISAGLVAWDMFYKSADSRMQEKFEAERQSKVGDLRAVAVRAHKGDATLQHNRILYAQQEARKIAESMGVSEKTANQAMAQALARGEYVEGNWEKIRQMARAAAKGNKPDEAAAAELAKIRGWEPKKVNRAPVEYKRPPKGGA